MKVLLNFYHPVIIDIAQSLVKHFKFDVTVSINTAVVDHYGSHKDLLLNLKSKESLFGFRFISLQEAMIRLKNKQFNLMGCDGVYNGDKNLIEISKNENIPYFCISGYPYLQDEDSKNVLSFSWFMPQIQWIQKYPTEYHIKEIAYKKLLSNEQNKKNILVWYPEFNHVKEFLKNNELPNKRSGFVSFINRYQECNKSLYEIFSEVKKNLDSFETLENFSGLSNNEVLEKMRKSKGLVHIKGYDCPGISLIEAMLLGTVPFLFQEFILGSFNQDLLINNHSCVLSDSISEFIKNLQSDLCYSLSDSTKNHAIMLTDFTRQRPALEKFLQKCLNLN
jgi:hypothetical protein